jgi:hypothetical protein
VHSSIVQETFLHTVGEVSEEILVISHSEVSEEILCFVFFVLLVSSRECPI